MSNPGVRWKKGQAPHCSMNKLLNMEFFHMDLAPATHYTKDHIVKKKLSIGNIDFCNFFKHSFPLQEH